MLAEAEIKKLEVTLPLASAAPAGKKLIAFLCTQCGKHHDAFPMSGKCECGHGSFKTVDVTSSPEHKALCQELQAELAKPVITVTAPPALDFAAPPAVPVPAPVASCANASPDVVTTKSQPESGLLSVLNKDFWACDNEKCGSDDLVHECPVPLPDGHQIGSRYQCLKCGHVGQILLQHEELVKLRGTSQVVIFRVGVDDFKVFGGQRNGPAASETRTAPTPSVKAAAVPEALAPVTRVQVVPETVTAPPKKSRGRPRKNQENPAPAPESFPVPAQASQPSPQAPTQSSKDIAALVTQIAGYESPQVSPEAFAEELRPQVESWNMAKLIKEAESLTNKVYDITKMTVPADKNVRQVLEEIVINEMIGKTCGVEA